MKYSLRKISIWILFSICSNSNVFAGIYECVNASGTVEFRDQPCEANVEQERFLPYSYQKTDPKASKHEVFEKQNKNKSKAEIKALEKKEKAEKRAVARTQKAEQKETDKKRSRAKRREARCLKVQENIKEIQEQLHRGCKPHQYHRLQLKLKQYELKKHQYCSLQPSD